MALKRIGKWSIEIGWSWNGWTTTLSDPDKTNIWHLLHIARCQSRDGLFIWTITLIWLNLKWGRANQRKALPIICP